MINIDITFDKCRPMTQHISMIEQTIGQTLISAIEDALSRKESGRVVYLGGWDAKRKN